MKREAGLIARRDFLRIASACTVSGRLVYATDNAQTPPAQGRPKLSLRGDWEFRLDPENEGIRRKWFSTLISYSEKIQVPGCWQAQGFGAANRHLRHDYQGKAWYRRIVKVPAEWAGKRVWIHIGGASNTADVFINNRLVGVVEGFLTPYEFDATEAIKPGTENVIVCRVDSTGPAPVGTFNLMGRWGGLYREVYLEARPDAWIDDVFVMPDVKSQTARVQVVLRRSPAGLAWQGDLSIGIQPEKSGSIIEGRGSIRFNDRMLQSEPMLVNVKLPDMRTWSPEDPFLYAVSVTLPAENQVLDYVGSRFGMRQFEVSPDGVLLLNGQPYFVRGIGEIGGDVLSGVWPADKQIYVDRFNLAKRYGFNSVRYLGTTPPREVFDAADEVGFLIMAEGEIYRKIPEVIPLLKKQVSHIARTYRNHPSWYIWSSGNEFFECQGDVPNPIWMDYIRYAHDTFKRLDSTRFFVASDGADVFPTDIITQRRVFDIGDPRYQSRPHIWHEFPNTYLGPLPDLTIKDKWTGIYQDYNCISRYREQVANLGLTSRYPDIRRRSIELFYLYLKNEFEKARQHKTMDGYHYWAFTDKLAGFEGDMTWRGMFSTVYEPEKFPDPGRILQFNRETVLLINADVDARVFLAGQERDVVLSVSHCGSAPLRDAQLQWELRWKGQTLRSGAVEKINAGVGDLKPVASVKLGPVWPKEPRAVRLHVRLQSETFQQENQWDFWVFPAQKKINTADVSSLVDEEHLRARYSFKKGLSLKDSRVALTDRLTPEVIDYAVKGGSVVFISEAGGFRRSQALRFWPPALRTSGTYVENHPALGDFPHDGFCSLQFYRIFGGASSAVDITDEGSIEREKLVPIIWGLSTGPYPGTSFSDWNKPDNRWKLSRHGLVCEARLGHGRILAAALRLLTGVREQQPEAGYLLDCLLDYAMSERFAPPSFPISPEEAGRLFSGIGV